LNPVRTTRLFRGRLRRSLLLLPLLSLLLAHAQTQAGTASEARQPILWRDPGDIRSKDLFYGADSEKGMPKPPLTFLSEESGGISPKFEVADSQQRKWKAKLGLEARPETVAARLLWAVGYFANENYYYAELKVKGIPKLKRGQEFASPDGVTGVRLQRHPGEMKGEWQWKDNPFIGTREFNGLRVMMALLRDWDLMDSNNAIFTDDSGNVIYEVTDVGASFGKTGPSYSDKKAKNNLHEYGRGGFIKKATADHVAFGFPARPPLIYIFMPKSFFAEKRLGWIGKHIPRQDAKWIGGLLAQLSHEQICDAFRAGGYTPEQVEGFAKVVESRIAALNAL
jgi:hypothetical protein